MIIPAVIEGAATAKVVEGAVAEAAIKEGSLIEAAAAAESEAVWLENLTAKEVTPLKESLISESRYTALREKLETCDDIAQRMQISRKAIEANTQISEQVKHFQIRPALKELENVPGAADVAAKLSIDNPSTYHGHLNELITARDLSRNGYKILEMDLRVQTAHGKTDIDILAQATDGRVFAIELKRVTDGITNNSLYFKPKIDKLADLVNTKIGNHTVTDSVFVNRGKINDNARDYAISRGIRIIDNTDAPKIKDLHRVIQNLAISKK